MFFNYTFVSRYLLRKNIEKDRMINKLFCTFVHKDKLESYIDELNSKYSILYNKIFVLDFSNEKEYIITYNTEQGTLGSIPLNTILVHRKKESNTLYTINALNKLITDLNNGVLDKTFRINWNDFKNSVLISSQNDKGYTKLDTTLHKVIRTN